MNIFATHRDPVLAAQAQVNLHVVKMSTEYAQILATAHRCLRGSTGNLIHPTKQILLKNYPYVLDEERETQQAVMPLATHINHPCNVWARHCNTHYLWLYDLFLATCQEYFYRYGQYHNPPKQIKTFNYANEFQWAPRHISWDTAAPFPQCMPDEFKDEDHTIAYRRYIKYGKKTSLHAWKHRGPPDWWDSI